MIAAKTSQGNQKVRNWSKAEIQSRTPIQWAPKHQAAVSRFIEIPTHPPILRYPDFDLPFVLHTDASNKSLGAALYQRPTGKLCVIGFSSRTLTPAEHNYHLHSGKLEFLALKWEICDKFRNYLYYAHLLCTQTITHWHMY